MGQRPGGCLRIAGWGGSLSANSKKLGTSAAERQPPLGCVVLDLGSQGTDALHMEVTGLDSGYSIATWKLLQPL